jgi:hypothetical protein
LFRGISARQRPRLLVLFPGPPLPQHAVTEGDRKPIWALKFILNILVDKNQVFIYYFLPYFWWIEDKKMKRVHCQQSFERRVEPG